MTLELRRRGRYGARMVKSHMSKVRKARRIQKRARRVGPLGISAAEKELMNLAGLEVQEGELRLIPGWDEEVSETLKATKAAGEDERPRLVDTTMLYAPRSGGVKRYLLSKKAWLEANRPGVAHSLVVPGPHHKAGDDGVVHLHATKLPFGDGYRWPTSVRRWAAWTASLNPSIIEAGDPYTPGQGALEAGQRAGCPVVGFCHSDPAGLAALHFGEWAKKPVEKRWARLFGQFDRVISPSRYIARRLEEAGIEDIVIQPLGVEVDTFRPDRRDRDWLLKKLNLPASARLLVFAGRPAREKNIDVLIQAVQKLGDPYHLVLIGAGAGLPAEDRVISLPYEANPKAVSKIIASCDAFVHANRQGAVRPDRAGGHGLRPPRGRVNAGGVKEPSTTASGQLAKSADPVHYAAAIEALFARDVEALGAAARVRAVERFSWGRVFEDLCMTYADVSGQRAFVEPGGEWAEH